MAQPAGLVAGQRRMSDGSPEKGIRELALGGIMLACVAVFGWEAAGNSFMLGDFGLDPGPAFLPVLMLYVLGVASVLLVIQGLARLSRVGWRIAISSDSLQSFIFPALMIVSLIAYVVLVDLIGFLALSLIFCVSWAIILVWQDYGFRQVRPLLIGGGGAALVVMVIFLLFQEVIGVPLS